MDKIIENAVHTPSHRSASSPHKGLYEVQIGGLSLKLRTSHDEQTVLNLVQVVEEKIQKALTTNSTVSFQNALVLAALNIAEELMLLKKTATLELDKIEDRTRQLIEQIEDISSPSNG